jgi:hypothetical protein
MHCDTRGDVVHVTGSVGTVEWVHLPVSDPIASGASAAASQSRSER